MAAAAAYLGNGGGEPYVVWYYPVYYILTAVDSHTDDADAGPAEPAARPLELHGGGGRYVPLVFEVPEAAGRWRWPLPLEDIAKHRRLVSRRFSAHGLQVILTLPEGSQEDKGRRKCFGRRRFAEVYLKHGGSSPARVKVVGGDGEAPQEVLLREAHSYQRLGTHRLALGELVLSIEESS